MWAVEEVVGERPGQSWCFWSSSKDEDGGDECFRFDIVVIFLSPTVNPRTVGGIVASF